MNVKTIPPKEVVVENRFRQNFDRKKMVELMESIKKHGQLQPGVCRLENEKIVLIAGERRLRACMSLDVPHSYVLKEEVTDPYILKEIELTENLEREDLTFQEVVFAREELHRLFEERHKSDPAARGNWSMDDTADSLGISKGILSEDIKLSMWIKEVPEVAQAKSKTEAKKLVKQLEETVMRKANLKQALEQSRKTSKALKEDKPTLESTGKEEWDMLLEYDRRLILGDFEEVAGQFQEGSFSVVVWDPPWGVDYDKVKKEEGSSKTYEDSQGVYMRKFPLWLSLIEKLMAPDSHLYLFFGIVHHQFVYETLEAKGFTTNRIPILWKKKGSHRTRNPKIWPGRCYEAIAYARKGSKPLVLQGRSDIIETPMTTKRMSMSHPSAKHPEVMRELLRRSCEPGDCVLDPMCGSGMFGVACDSLQKELSLDWWMVEKDDDYRAIGLELLRQGHTSLVGDESPPEEEGAYKEMIPGSKEWLNHWDNHPEEQDEMQKWVDALKGERR